MNILKTVSLKVCLIFYIFISVQQGTMLFAQLREQTSPANDQSQPTIKPPISKRPKFNFNPIIQPKEKYKLGTIVKKAGSPRLLIARPVFAPYSTETKTMYISAVTEAYFHFKLGAIPGILVIPTERITSTIPYFRDFSRRISSSAYKKAAKRLGAAYLLYSEYEPKGKKIKIATEVFSVADNKKITGSVAEIELSKFEDGLFDFTIEAAGALIETIPKPVQEFLAEPVIGKKMQALGEAVVSLGEYSKKHAESVAPKIEKLAKDKKSYLAQFVASQIFAHAGRYNDAIYEMQNLERVFGNQYPMLQLHLAHYHRLMGSFDDALSAVNKAASTTYLNLSSQIEKACILEAQNNLKKAKRTYESVLAHGGEDGDILFQLALVSIGLNNLSQAQQYLKQAAAAGRALVGSDYYELGLRYESLGSVKEAITAYRTCLGLNQENEEVWKRLSDLYISSGKEPEAAQCYINLFHVNNNEYKELLFKSGILFDNNGYYSNAKDAYELFLARGYDSPEVKVRLAKIEIYNGNCEKAVHLVDNVDTTGAFGDVVKSINTQCNKQVRIVVASETSDKSWKAVFFWRLSSSIIMFGGSGSGYYMDTQVKKHLKSYNEYDQRDPNKSSEVKITEITKIHDDLEQAKRYRDISYVAAGFGGASLILSFVLPTLFH